MFMLGRIKFYVYLKKKIFNYLLIMFIFSENTNINNNEHILVTIKWNKKTHTLTVVPDFTSLNTAGYRIDVDMLSDTRYVYRYWLLNISHIEEESRIQKMEKLKNEVLLIFSLSLIFNINVII